ncbi:MAG: ankyrin repeat domain-containing protein [Alphaproteobacteria bacterium]|nr:ankyrin repeat domain-containing protein [Alphaproteobacteria bacterium]
MGADPDIYCANRCLEAVFYDYNGTEAECLSLIKEGADVNVALLHPKYSYPNPALVQAVQQNFTELALILLDHGADVNAKGIAENTALIHAASNGNERLVKALLEKGADVNLGSEYDITPIMFGALSGKKKVVTALIDNGADIYAKNRGGGNALALVHDKPDMIALMIDAHKQRVTRLFETAAQKGTAQPHKIRRRTPNGGPDAT